ncbi:hypothetical protein C8F04DRAFT_1209279 [Mycena alexandri]|uniref:RING-type E3 ubiquitin transferase n=1 Tax=Mycena alexandri TaxID=1745969 RepID=A0AAD6X8E6_9AGAR|nr:hypothetical protein C8F04DRAFT_1209279 [Mycena alexandri]
MQFSPSFAVSVTIANACRNYSNFYSVAIYLSKSSRSVLILANFGFLVALLVAHVAQKIFFGALRPSEIESLLAFTIFRDEFDTTFVFMFGFLLFVKSFHWIAADRIEWMDQRPYPGPSLLFHVRMTALFLILWSTDLLLFVIAVDSTMYNGIGGMVLFASEYGILMATVANTVSKYLLCAYELRGENAPPWENKSMWVFYIELATDFLKLSTYLVFFIIIMTFYGIPLNILRDVYVTGRSLVTRLRSLHRYQTATRNMDQRYPNATEQEMAAMSDHTCIICREEMVLPPPPEDPAAPPANVDGPNTTPKKLPCGHIFHFNCLRSWLERQQSCPTCPQIPGAAPQGPNAAGQGQNPAANNPLGLVGRLFAPPGQAGPAGPAQAQFPQNGNIAINPANGAAGAAWNYTIVRVPRTPQPRPRRQRQPLTTTSTPTPTTTSSPPPSQPAESTSQASGSPPASSAAPSRRLDLPALIPVYDYTAIGTNPIPPSPFTPQARPPMPGVRSSSSQPVPSTSHPGGFRPRPSTRGAPPDPRYQQQRPPISQLPPTLTDEQLALMDTVTREAIDERLRVLEGVSGAVYRCIDDLMRMRSALPISTPAANAVPGPSTSSGPAPTAGVSTSTSTTEDVAVAAAVPIPDSPATEAPPPEA